MSHKIWVIILQQFHTHKSGSRPLLCTLYTSQVSISTPRPVTFISPPEGSPTKLEEPCVRVSCSGHTRAGQVTPLVSTEKAWEEHDPQTSYSESSTLPIPRPRPYRSCATCACSGPGGMSQCTWGSSNRRRRKLGTNSCCWKNNRGTSSAWREEQVCVTAGVVGHTAVCSTWDQMSTWWWKLYLGHHQSHWDSSSGENECLNQITSAVYSTVIEISQSIHRLISPEPRCWCRQKLWQSYRNFS